MSRAVCTGMMPLLQCLGVLWLCLAGCAAREPGPEETLRRYLAAVEAGEVEVAYGLMGEEYRRKVSMERFAASVAQTRDEVLALKAYLGEASTPPSKYLADLHHGVEQPVRLARRGGEWEIVSGVLDYYPQRTPRQALRSFVKALERRRVDVLLRFMPRAQAKEENAAPALRQYLLGQNDAVERLLRALRPHLDAPIEQAGGRALLRYEGLAVLMVWEEQAWRVVDPDATLP